MSKPKIKICDFPGLREPLEEAIPRLTVHDACTLAQVFVRHALKEMGDKATQDLVHAEVEAISCLHTFPAGHESVTECRKVAFSIHRLAREMEDVWLCTALRVMGHAVATVHVREHLLIASDYLVKLGNLSSDNDVEIARIERLYQLDYTANLESCPPLNLKTYKGVINGYPKE